MTVRLLRDTDAVREREDDGPDASAQLLQRWVAATVRDRVLRGAVAWPLHHQRLRYDRLQHYVARRR